MKLTDSYSLEETAAKSLQSCPTLCGNRRQPTRLPSLGFSRQEHWSGLPFPSPMHESEREVTPSCLTLHNPMDCSPPGSAIHRIFQARVLQWGAIAFSEQAASAYQCPQTHEHPREWEYVHAARTVGFWDSRAHISTQSKK